MPQMPEIPGPGTQQSLWQSQSERLLQAPKAKDRSGIEKSARQFESLLISKWLEEAQQSFATVPGADDEADADPTKEQYQSLSLQFLSESISAAGGLGIAKMIVEHLAPSAAQPQVTDNKQLPKDLPAGSGIRPEVSNR